MTGSCILMTLHMTFFPWIDISKIRCMYAFEDTCLCDLSLCSRSDKIRVRLRSGEVVPVTLCQGRVALPNTSIYLSPPAGFHDQK